MSAATIARIPLVRDLHPRLSASFGVGYLSIVVPSLYVAHQRFAIAKMWANLMRRVASSLLGMVGQGALVKPAVSFDFSEGKGWEMFDYASMFVGGIAASWILVVGGPAAWKGLGWGDTM
jgi:hypothetical protein